MAETAKRNDPFLSFRFHVTLDDLAVAGFSECAGLQMETEVKDYAEGGLNTHLLKFIGRSKQSNLTLKRGIVDRALWDWYFDISQGKVDFRSGTIVIFDPSGNEPVMEWQFTRAFPLKWQGSDLNAAQNSIAVETLELCHQGLSRRR